MKLNKEKFLKTEFGCELECMITTWNQALEKNRRTGDDKDILNTLAWCQAQWEVYKMAIKHMYGVEYHFSRTDEYYGLCNNDGSDWLMKVDRGLAGCNGPVPDMETDIDKAVEAVIHRTQEHLSELNGEVSY